MRVTSSAIAWNFHRHLSETAGRELTQTAIDDTIARGTIGIRHKLIEALKADKTGGTGRIARRVSDVAKTLSNRDPKARVFAMLLRKLSSQAHGAAAK